MLIKIPTKSQVKPKLKYLEDYNERPIDHFVHTRLTDNSIEPHTQNTEMFIIYTYSNYYQPWMN